MIVNGDELRKKVNLLGMAVSKNVASKQYERMLRFETDGDTVYGYSIDGVNNIRVEIGKSTDDFYAIVDYNTFSNFIKSCDGDITLETKGKFIQIKSSNVKCKLPTYNHEAERGKTGINDPTGDYKYSRKINDTIELGTLKSVLDPTHVVETYEKIYFGDNIMVSDTDNVLIIEKRIFDEDILLDLSSVEILNSISNVEYDIIKEGKLNKLAVKSDELYATMVITENSNDDFQYNDFMELFTDIDGGSVKLDTTILSKAMSAAAMFKTVPNLVFNPKGIFLRIDSVEFIYKISDDTCEDHTFELTNDAVKKLTALGKELTIYYTNQDLMKCETDGKKEIISIKEVVANG